MTEGKAATAAAEVIVPEKDEKGRWVRGNIGGPGRHAGIPNKVTHALREGVLEAWQELGGIQWLVSLGQSDPRCFAALLAKCLPREVKVSGGVAFEAILAASYQVEAAEPDPTSLRLGPGPRELSLGDGDDGDSDG